MFKVVGVVVQRRAVLALVFGLTLPASSQVVPTDSNSDSIRRWVAQHRAAAIDLLLPPPPATEDVDLETAWVAIIRVVPPEGLGTESYVRLTKFWSGKVTAHIVRPANGSIQANLGRIHSDRPNLSLLESVALIPMQTYDLDHVKMPSLRRAAQDLQRTCGHYVFDNVIMLDATRYELWTIGGPQRLHVTLLGANRGEGKPTLPLLKAIAKIQAIADQAR